MQLYFIRHGESENNALYARTGSSEGRSEDPLLTAVGRKQVEHVARFVGRGSAFPALSVADGADGRDPLNLGGFSITHIYCSPMVRAVDTATAIAQALHLPPRLWLGLHEVGGIFLDDPATGERVGRPGKGQAFFQACYPELILPEDMNPAGWWNRPFEERDMRPARGRQVLAELLERHGSTDDRVVLVSHGGFYNHFLGAVFDLDRETYWFGLSNAAITRIDFAEGRVWVRYMNRTDFMPQELIT